MKSFTLPFDVDSVGLGQSVSTTINLFAYIIVATFIPLCAK